MGFVRSTSKARSFGAKVGAGRLWLAATGASLGASMGCFDSSTPSGNAPGSALIASASAHSVEAGEARSGREGSDREAAGAANSIAGPATPEQACRSRLRDQLDAYLGDVWIPDPEDMYPDPSPSGTRLLARKYLSSLRATASSKSTVIAYAREGALLPVIAEVKGKGCSSGKWYKVEGGAFACTSSDFRLIDAGHRPRPYFIEDEHLPYRYIKYLKAGVPIMRREPSRKDLQKIDALVKAGKSKGWPSSVIKKSQALEFDTVVQEKRVGSTTLFKNARGYWFRKQDVKVLKPPVRHGVMLSKNVTLPLAYVRGSQPLRCDCAGDSQLRACGKAKKHDVVMIHTPKSGAKEVFLRGGVRATLPRAGVRVVSRERRPAGIPAGAKWIHVRLSEQTLVAYEGKNPVYATIIASGAKGYETPTGTFRVQRKFLTTTMRGADDEFGRYTVGDVPWTLFYDGSYALHGAYWHDEFGAVRSHGCTNIPPDDARWLYHWSDPTLPVGWHGWGWVPDGTWVHITDK